MSEMASYYETIKSLKAELLEMKDPRAVQAGDAEADEQLAVCAKNAAVYARLEVKAAARLALLEKEMGSLYLAKMIEYTDSKLESMSAVRSQKDKLVKAELVDHQYLIDETDAARKYFGKMGSVMIEWVNIYKKFRAVD